MRMALGGGSAGFWMERESSLRKRQLCTPGRGWGGRTAGLRGQEAAGGGARGERRDPLAGEHVGLMEWSWGGWMDWVLEVR